MLIQCRLCDSASLKFKFKIREYAFYQCRDCYYIQVDAGLIGQESDEIYTKQYFSNAKYKDTITLEEENRRRLDFISGYITNKDSKILDYGCGGGEFIKSASGSYAMYGMDVSEDAIKKAKSINPQCQQSLERISEGFHERMPNFFDGIAMWDVLEHIRNPADICKKIITCLKPGGFLFLSTPNPETITAKVMDKYWLFMTPPEHLGFFP